MRVAEAEDFIRRWHRDDGENDLSTLMLRASSANERIPMGSLDIWCRRHDLRPDLYPLAYIEVSR
ncbi:hypothetical protein ACO2RV_04665 [Ancylobacter sp. VNQ12]|uniref:hypothetical protein n=1 Tax=Ancylobacter sp. VNQ12 TaxID=3400920 RepID=UPI003C0630E8